MKFSEVIILNENKLVALSTDFVITKITKIEEPLIDPVLQLTAV